MMYIYPTLSIISQQETWYTLWHPAMEQKMQVANYKIHVQKMPKGMQKVRDRNSYS